MKDSNYNNTARSLVVKPVRVKSPETYDEKMMRTKGITAKTLLQSENEYVHEIVAGIIYIYNLKIFYKIFDLKLPLLYLVY